MAIARTTSPNEMARYPLLQREFATVHRSSGNTFCIFFLCAVPLNQQKLAKEHKWL
ncbi:Uncharacterized protein pbN1_26580 [Aromatoleum bremense]|nr:Uncharacterized protein pbN1_26580 [Aromatoleum bremense]